MVDDVDGFIGNIVLFDNGSYTCIEEEDVLCNIQEEESNELLFKLAFMQVELPAFGFICF